MINENSNIKYLKGVGEKKAELLSKLGIYSVGDLLRHYPRSYRDWSKTTLICDTVIGSEYCIKVYVSKTPVGARIRKDLTIFKTTATDGTDDIDIIIYNNKYAAQSLSPDTEYYLYGKISGNLYRREMSSPEILKAVDSNNIVHPIYAQTKGINSKYIEKLVSTAFSLNQAPCREVIPTLIREKLCLIKTNEAIREIHFPSSEDMLLEARRSLVFEELFILQLGLLNLKGCKKTESDIFIEDFSKDFYTSLPFKLTNAQLRAVNDCQNSMSSGYAMNRLLQGDVGSGKTMVAAAVMYSTVKSGYQAAFMAPTEILANQHYETVCKFFKDTDIKIRLLTGSSSAKDKKEIKALLSEGEIDILIGTHAIIQSDVIFKIIGLAITDEQHRFGVNQRNDLTKKGSAPHTLVMSATPIPRTLALMIYGDLDISVLDELPPGRQPIETYCISSQKRQRAYNYIKNHLDDGRQAYIVCPLIEENDTLELAAVDEFSENLRKEDFKDYTVGVLHGKLKPKEKDAIMSDFAKGRIQVLVSTTVVEVGVDVPNAVIMVIENAERFGLSQLHQLRGRIGRGQYKSTCILISDARNEAAVSRLKIMTKTCDGFKIADEDLRLRGPGDFFGNRQHGLPELKISMLTDTTTLKEANTFAKDILLKDPSLSSPEHEGLKEAVDKLFKDKTIN